MVSEPDTRLCVSEEAVSRMRVKTQGGVLVRTLGPEGGWIVISHIGWGVERNTFYKGAETFP